MFSCTYLISDLPIFCFFSIAAQYYMSQPILRRTDNGVTSGRRYRAVAPEAPVVLPGRTMKPQALKVSYEDTGRSNSATRFPPSQLPTANRVSYTDNYPNRANIRYSTPPSKAGVRTKSPGQAHWGPPTPLGRTQTSVGRSTAAAARTRDRRTSSRSTTPVPTSSIFASPTCSNQERSFRRARSTSRLAKPLTSAN